MKRRVFRYLLILALIGGCATETKVVDNTFYSSYPKLEVTVSPEFEYVDQQGIKTDSEVHGSGYYETIFGRVFMFIDRVSERLVAISVTKAPGDTYWLAPSMAWDTIKDKLAYGKCKLGRHTYDYCIYWENGNIAKMHLRNASGDAFRVMLLYVEPKTNYQSLTSAQEVLEAFNKKCQAAFTVTGARHKRADKEKQQLAYIPEAVVPSDDDETLIADEVERLRRERERLEAEKKFLEKEREKLAYVPKSVTKAKVSLRTEPRKISDSYLRTTLPKYGFYDASLYPQGGSFENHFVDNGDGTITDEATGLMWQKSGSPSTTSKSRAQAYLNKLNKNQLAGHWNWRLPTIDELASLLERDKINGVHINPVFDKKQKRCWSSDRPDHVGRGQRLERWWLVDFLNGRGTIATISWYVPAKHFENNYVRAVRSIAVRPVE